MEEQRKPSFIDNFVDFIFSKDERKWLILIFLLGLVLRFIVASHHYPVADEMIHGVHALGVSELKPLSTITQGPIWFYITDFSYRLFGVYLWSGRIMSILFGSLSIILVYLLSSMYFNRKIGLISAFLFAISPYQLAWARIYMDESLLFFVLLGAYLFLKDYKTKGYITPLSAVFLGIGCLIKIISGVFIVVFSAFLITSIINNRKKEMYKKSLKNAFYFFLIIAISLTPLISYNYFLYKSKGIVDLPFAMYFGINTEVYQGPGLAHGSGFMINTLPTNIKSVVTEYFFKQDMILFPLFILGLVLFIRDLKKDREHLFKKYFLIVLFAFSFLFIVSTIVLDTHYTYFTALFAILGGNSVNYLANRIKKKNSKKVIYAILIFVLIVNLYSIKVIILTKSSTEKLREFAIDEIGSNDLVITDSRIYRGNTAWIFNDKHYIEANNLPQLIEYSRQTGNEQQIRTFFIECGIDDCGWGTIKDQPDLNQSMEGIASLFKNISLKTTSFKGGGSQKDIGIENPSYDQFIVYEALIQFNPSLFNEIDQTHNWFFYDIPRNRNSDNAFDKYHVNGFVDNLLKIISYLILYSLIVIALLSILFVFYLAYSQKDI